MNKPNLGPTIIFNEPKPATILGIGFREIKFFVILFWIGKYSLKNSISPAILSGLNPEVYRGGKSTSSKHQIYQIISKNNDFARKHIIDYVYIPYEKKFEDVKGKLSLLGKHIVLKPDKGARSKGIAITTKDAERIKVLEARGDTDYIAQKFVDYPYELSIYYYKYPNWKKGKILGIAEKKFGAVIGDGKKNISELTSDIKLTKPIKVSLESRYKTLKYIPKKDEIIILTTTVSHNDEGEYYDRKDLISPKLENVFNKIIGDKKIYFCRFDIRTKSIHDFYDGKNFKILELNVGPTAVILHAFDPRYSKKKQLQICYDGYIHAFNMAKMLPKHREERLLPYIWFLIKDEIPLFFLDLRIKRLMRRMK